MPRFFARKEKIANMDIITLIDREQNIQAKVIPSIGNNLVSFSIGFGDKYTELIWIPTEIENLQYESRKFFGNPVLFPFPGRIPDGKFMFQGQKFQVPVNFDDGCAIHGFVFDKKWQIAELSSLSNDRVHLVSIFRSTPEIERHFPFPFELEMRYTLRELELEINFLVKNRGDQRMPFGYGLHPYFLLGDDNRDNWDFYFPASKHYELQNLLPSGATEAIPDELDFRMGKSLDEIYMDDLFGELKKNKEGGISCWIKNRKTNLQLTVVSDANFEHYVLYAPKWGPFICIEPYTCIPDAFNLTEKGIKTGLRTLAPSESFHAKILFQLKIK
jgi:aldose 1-epimerase